jgi:hypothetical protein
MSVSGIIEQNGLATALQLVSRGRSSGVFVANTAYATASIEFREGEIFLANSTMTSKLGELIVKKGLVSSEKLDAALWVQRQDKEWRALGRVLVDVRLLQEATVQSVIEEQIARVLDEVLRWDQGTFRFERRPPSNGVLIVPQCRDLGQYEVKVAMLRHDALITRPA